MTKALTLQFANGLGHSLTSVEYANSTWDVPRHGCPSAYRTPEMDTREREAYVFRPFGVYPPLILAVLSATGDNGVPALP